MAAETTLIAGRYQLVQRIGAGAMGEVWKAQDRRFESRVVAIKLLKDDARNEDGINRNRFQRLIQEEAAQGALTVGLVSNLLDEVLQCGKGVEQMRVRVRQDGGASGQLTAERAHALFDEMVGDPAFSENARMRARLRRMFHDEANSVANLRHDNIVSISDYGEDNGTPFVAMEFIDGQTLMRMIQRAEPMPRTRQLRLMEGLCSGLAYAHRRNLIHRDIKPANLIVENGTDSLKILDFGVVRRVKEGGESSLGAPVGTLCYMSPEQITGQPIDKRSDIFAVGAVFYELLTGRRAFPVGTDIADLMARIQRSAPTPPTEIVPDIEPEVIRILNRALEKSPAYRYQDLSEMERELARVRTRLERELDEAPTLMLTPTDAETLVAPPPTEPNIERLLRDGQQALAAGDLARAKAAAEEVLDAAPDNEPARTLKTQAEAREASRREAEEIAARQSRIRALVDRADRSATAGQLDEAITLVQEALTLEPERHELIVRLEQWSRIAAQAREDAKRRERLNAVLQRARAQLARGDLDQADATLQEASSFTANDATVAALARDIAAARDARDLEIAREKAETEAARQRDVERQRAERERAEQAERERVERVERERVERERAERERLERERIARERAEQERAERQRADRERAERERLAREADARANDEERARQAEAARQAAADQMRRAEADARAADEPSTAMQPREETAPTIPPGRKQPNWTIAAIVAGVAVVVIAAVLLFRRGEEPVTPPPTTPPVVVTSGTQGRGEGGTSPVPAPPVPDTTPRPAPPVAATPVSVDIRPWANVQIEGKDGSEAPAGVFTTPFVINLKPGRYTLRCENGGLTRAATFDIEVAADRPLAVSRTMPGFSATSVVDTLLGQSR